MIEDDEANIYTTYFSEKVPNDEREEVAGKGRPDIAYAVSITSRYQSNPGSEHWAAVKMVLKYLRRTKDMFLVYGGAIELRVEAYTDADFQSDVDDRSSNSGYVFTLNGGVVSWKSKKQDVIADSTTVIGAYLCDLVGLFLCIYVMFP
ncbi:hypothetical protein PS1_038203 [Malus domestica]